jgi:hypothetical protein
MVRLLAMKSHVKATARTCLRNLTLTRTIVVFTGSNQRQLQQQPQHLGHVKYSIRPLSPCSRIHKSNGSNIQSLDFPSPSSISSSSLPSKCYLSTKPTTDVVHPTMTQDVNDATLVPPSTTSSSSSTTKDEHDSTEPSLPPSIPLVYESPLGSVVSKLRTVSLCTALIGMTGVPCMIALKGGAIPETGILAAALLFVSGSIGSTAAIHFVFSPYVYKIEQIPIRICSSSTVVPSAPAETTTGNSGSNNSSTETATKSIKDTLLKAWTRTLFLRNDAVIFDPTIDVQPYQGLRPMCNFQAKGHPLYVHPGT